MHKWALANLQELIPTLAAIITDNTNYVAKVEIKSHRFAIEYVLFVYAWMDVTSYPAEIMFAWTDTNSSQCCL